MSEFASDEHHPGHLVGSARLSRQAAWWNQNRSPRPINPTPLAFASERNPSVPSLDSARKHDLNPVSALDHVFHIYVFTLVPERGDQSSFVGSRGYQSGGEYRGNFFSSSLNSFLISALRLTA